ncbi:hypothetical protein OG455_05905 [Kitasatospora sp. NBC_01287]|uniref:hypothetical protein n=1 Tax=Kitasatospora sp. NBC_01287 TaxID=2903573 RepID=UPI002256B97A|nr:hypothetical protein [Kitasatospora sp. NBC_01287]MCX4745062.1 hypothetical protein [Kitasatospora sp. NBC_01287]
MRRRTTTAVPPAAAPGPAVGPLLAVGSCLLLLAGCAAAGRAGAPNAAPSVVSPTPTPTSAAQTGELPLLAFAASPQESVTLSRATALLTADCMHRLGFAAFTMTPAASTAPTDAPTVFGYLDDALAARDGFHSPDSLQPKPTGGPRLDPAEFTAETGLAPTGLQQQPSVGSPPQTSASPAQPPAGGGIPAGGCDGEAARALATGASAAGSTAYDEVTDQSLQRTVADDRVLAATAGWRSCMRQKGFDYSDPQSLAAESWGATVTPPEIDIARADVACTRQTNLSGIAFAVRSAIQRQLIDQRRPELQAERAAVDARLRNAARVLAEHGQ